LYELDLRVIAHNLLATLSRRPEAYHETILRHVHGGVQQGGTASIHDRVVFKQEGLDRQRRYDWELRKSLLDHCFEPQAILNQVAAIQAHELGDFVTEPYEHRIRRSDDGVQLALSRNGQVAGTPVRITKEITLRPKSDTIEVRYVLENLPRDR